MDAPHLLITSELPQDTWGSARIRFPAVYVPTQEAVLIAGSLLQLGDSDVQVAVAEMEAVDTVDAITVRVSLYQDQTKLSCILQSTLELQVCRNSACAQTCCMFHPAVDETFYQLFLDLWARNYCKQSGSKAKPAEAELFQFLARIPSSAIGHVFKTQAAGLFFDPRAPDGSPHASWGVVLLPGVPPASATYAPDTAQSACFGETLKPVYGVSLTSRQCFRPFARHMSSRRFAYLLTTAFILLCLNSCVSGHGQHAL